MKKIVKPKNLLAFKIWLEKLGYSVKEMQDGRGFNFRFKKEYGMVTAVLTGNELAQKLGAEFEDHLASPNYPEVIGV
ncbi:hypothetical protein RFH42_16285 [Acinetobacter rudis]|uniref:hypothetical protein n=1 Tax=Acinetobacter rudis TaxID=632955 RepID=UPI00280C754B|nr:hypothetical protein [Acinetobacter rudis]MDQ8954509.1 hypothetical protein [Acinetobacter rudis]